MGGRGQGSGAAGDQCICFKRKMYLFQVQNVFFQSAKCICSKGKIYLLKHKMYLPTHIYHIYKKY